MCRSVHLVTLHICVCIHMRMFVCLKQLVYFECVRVCVSAIFSHVHVCSNFVSVCVSVTLPQVIVHPCSLTLNTDSHELKLP